jgi:hypothetical protein
LAPTLTSSAVACGFGETGATDFGEKSGLSGEKAAADFYSCNNLFESD